MKQMSFFYQLRGSGGAIYCKHSTLIINSEYSLFANNFAENAGGAIHATGESIIIKGSVTFMKNNANYTGGGAITLIFVTLTVSGNISFIDNQGYTGGALLLSEAKFLIVSEERMENENYYNIFNDETKFCINGNLASIEAEYTTRVLDSYFNESGKATAVFRGNMAILYGGGIKSNGNSDITILDGSIRFENNQAMNGGGMYMVDNSKLILSSFTQNDVSFILNHAQNLGGALYVEDSHQCSDRIRDLECFVSIYGYNLTRPSLLFLNNSAGLGGSILYGGQLNKCRLRLMSNVRIDTCKCDNKAYYDYYRLEALEIFMNLSRNSESDSIPLTSLASQPEQIHFCQLKGEIITLDDQTLHLSVYPGEKFPISVIALDQTDSPVPATVYIEKRYNNDDNIQGDKYRLSPSRQSINDPFCS
jgi:predicted outer membrane repeat protein